MDKLTCNKWGNLRANASKLSAKPLNKMFFICITPLFEKEGIPIFYCYPLGSAKY